MVKTGSGKTTLLDLITRLYDTTSGKIFIDNIDIKKINLSSLRSYIGYVPQDGYLFSGTIKDNIIFQVTIIIITKWWKQQNMLKY